MHNENKTEKKIRIALVDDHTLFRSGIRALLSRQSDFEIVGEAADGLEGVKLIEQVHPDLVLLDLDMPVMNGHEALAQILGNTPAPAVLMLTVSEDGDDLAECMRLGASGYLLKKIDADFLLQSIRSAVAGDSVISPEMTSKLVMKLRHDRVQMAPVINPDIDSLTPRERQTLAYLSRGLSNKEIARALDLAESTVKVHVQSVLRKLNIKSRVQAAVFAVEHHLDKF
ncbi:MAG: response regulator [Duodenibacillus sp.]